MNISTVETFEKGAIVVALETPSKQSRLLTSRVELLLRRTRSALAPLDGRTSMLPRPGARALIWRPGPDPLHVLLIGGGVLAGLGLARHDLGLPGLLADSLVRRTRRGVRMHVSVDEDLTAPDSIGRLQEMRLGRFDSVAVVLGAAPAERGVAEPSWRTAVERLARALDKEAAASARLQVYDSASAATPANAYRTAIRAAQLTEVSESVFEQTRRIRFEVLHRATESSEIPGVFSTNAYRAWAEAIASRLGSDAPDPSSIAGRDAAAGFRDADQRAEDQAAAAARLLRERIPDREALMPNVRILQQAFGVEGAAVGLLDGDRLRFIASSARAAAIPDGIRAAALRRDPPLLINDTLLEPTPDAQALASVGIRFWASCPIHSWDGYRIGVVQLSDSHPQELSSSQLELVDDVAGRVEQFLSTASR